MGKDLIEINVTALADMPAKLRLAAATMPGSFDVTLTPPTARALAAALEEGARASVAAANARQHVAEAELLARLWCVLAVTACAVATVILVVTT